MGRTQSSKGTKDILNPSPGKLDGKIPSTVGAGRYSSYPAYKDSGVEWLGEIPAHWDVKRTNSILDRNDSGVWGEDSDDDGIIVIRSTEQAIDGKWKITEPARRRLTIVEYATSRLQEGDLVVTKSSGSSLHIGKTSIVTEEVEALNCCFSNFMQRLRVNESSIPGFVLYVLNGETGRKQFEYLSATTTGLANLNGDLIGRVRFARPPTREQRTIAAFLDRETAKIDALVAKKGRLIELLQEKRAALVTRAVTKGLDHDVPMKDSGVEWLGGIPAHWDVAKLKTKVPDITVGIVVTPSKYYVEEGIVCLRSLNIALGHITTEDIVYISDAANSLHRKSQIFEGDIVVVRTGRAGVAVVVPPEFNGVNCIDLLIIRRSMHIFPQFLYYFLNSITVRGQVSADSVGSIQEHYNTGTLSNLFVPSFSVHEQRAISHYLDQETGKIDTLVAMVREAIDRLKELRTALISAAVTGKIDVRETAA